MTFQQWFDNEWYSNCFTIITVIVSGIISLVISAAYYHKGNRNNLKMNIIHPIIRLFEEGYSQQNYKNLCEISKDYTSRYMNRNEMSCLNQLLDAYKEVCRYNDVSVNADSLFSYFEYKLKKNNINPETDLEILQNVDFGSTSAAFTSGIGDYTVEFEPSATLLEQQGEGHVIASLGVESGYVPYTAYCAKKSYIKKNPDVIQKFTNATQKGLDYVNTHSSAEIAAIIAPQFKETDIATITAIVERYKSQDTWKTSTVFTEDSFNLLQDILTQAGELKSPVPYSSLVTTEFSEKALNKQ